LTEREDGRGNVIQERVLARPKATHPILVCGLPGSGYVGKLAADHLIALFRLKKVAEYRSGEFPPQVNVGPDGVALAPKGELYFSQRTKGKGIFVFTADAQPTSSEGEYELAEAVVRFAKGRGVKSVYTLAAYITGAFTASPKVYGAATSRTMLDELAGKGVTLMKDGGISGMNGLLIGMAALNGMQGACLLGETSGYMVDAGASKSVLELLSGLVGIPIDTSKLKEKAEETEKVISQLKGMSDQANETTPALRRETRPGYIG